MGLQIEDGKGTGKAAEVDENNRLRVYAVTEPEMTATSHYTGDSYSWTAVSADIDAGDTALLVCNDSTTKHLYISDIYVWADVATQFKIHFPAYVTPAGTAVIGLNLNRTSGKLAEATAKADETANVFAAANVLLTLRNDEGGTEGQTQRVNLQGAVILGYHDCIAVDIIAESGAFEVTIMGYYHD